MTVRKLPHELLCVPHLQLPGCHQTSRNNGQASATMSPHSTCWGQRRPAPSPASSLSRSSWPGNPSACYERDHTRELLLLPGTVCDCSYHQLPPPHPLKQSHSVAKHWH